VVAGSYSEATESNVFNVIMILLTRKLLISARHLPSSNFRPLGLPACLVAFLLVAHVKPAIAAWAVSVFD